jgi:lysophospholipid acyltransferase (LPLAT)-like uncharacterized protein
VTAPALAVAAVPPVAALLVSLIGATLRLTVGGLGPLIPLWRAGRPLIYVAWHGRILMIPWLNARLRRTHGARAARVLVSRSRDGELMARFVARFGLDSVRGSSSRGGADAVRALAAAVGAGEDVAIIPDGPRGPGRRVQPGAVALAALTGAPIVPLALSARPCRRLATWDEFLVPAPFARCAALFGPAIEIARDADREAACVELGRTLDDVTRDADRLVAA